MEIAKKITKTVNKFFRENRKTAIGVKLIVYSYIMFAVSSLAIYLTSWCMLIFNGTAKMNDLLALIKELFAPQTIAALIAVAMFFTDKNKNGIPDNLEKEEKSGGRLYDK